MDLNYPDDLAEVLRVMGHRARARRKALGLSQTTLADQSWTAQTIISRIELGKVNLRMSGLLRLAYALDIDPAALIPQGERGAPSPRQLPSVGRPGITMLTADFTNARELILVPIGANIRVQREAYGWSVADLAGELETVKRMVVLYEQGRRDISLGTLFRIAEVMWLDRTELLPSLTIGPGLIAVGRRTSSGSTPPQRMRRLAPLGRYVPVRKVRRARRP
ncbi:MAG TPA: helix-turn-helix transcriptional regulator [Acidimicrobiales bacterium]|nr:helix-turn-helix transcriptional regulator [Acidimicrobiales bacterium]